MSYGDDYDDARAGNVPAQTRTHLPEDPSTRPRRPPASPGRSMVTIVAVVVLLVAAIVFANQARDDDGESSGDDAPQAQADPTSPTGELPVDGATNGIPSGFPQTEQGAQSAAANYAVALGGTGMFNPTQRAEIVATVSSAETRDDLLASYDADYGPQLNETIGLDANGVAPEGSTFVNRTLPVGSTVGSYSDTTAEVSVWCAGLFGVAGLDSRNPVRTSWFTMHLTLTWEGSDWKVVTTEQSEGPTPVNGDNRISGAEEIAEAVEEFGGFTYAR
ncbi:hypothetical protein FH609_028835 [Streptomyces sp. 3MP-14]|uniref:DUF8175 domain-containing protein n=1 Tax=Streptomyces mimosae TaxID=2586635 RepID=A0A5N5ZM91_9ACTN|nr:MULTISPECIES: hypothetical protein [Streptomyces]KAB8157079.1 hypothetical protein FH607_030405 [Streptomyces mimosae]KAB8172702.1 hypothetical protein FH609_028835 [Streptomyces sp. 3MP-14]